MKEVSFGKTSQTVRETVASVANVEVVLCYWQAAPNR